MRTKSGIPKRLLFDNHIVQLPKEFNKMKMTFLFITLFYTGLKLFSFFIEFGKNQIVKSENGEGIWHAYLGIIFVGLYYIQSSISKGFDIFFESIEINNDEKMTGCINKVCANLLSKLRGKVFKRNKAGILEAMTSNTFIDSSRNYISTLWRYQVGFWSRMADIIILLIMFAGYAKVSLSSFIILIMLVVSAFIILLAIKRIQYYKKIRSEIKDADQEKNESINDLLNIRALNDKHTQMMVNRIVNAFTLKFQIIRKKNKTINLNSLFESIVLIISVILIILIECRNANFNSAFILSLISILTINATIISSLKNVVYRVERMMNDLKDIETYYPDTALIIEEYEKLEYTKFYGYPAKIISVSIPALTISYMKKAEETAYSLTIPKEFTFMPGDVVFITGPTGCGKTTFLKAVSNRMKFDNFELNYQFSEEGDVSNEFFETSSKLGSGNVLTEIVFSDEFDEEKLLRIFDILHVTEFLTPKNNDIINYLKNVKADDFSNGQNQRLILARNLYNLSPSAITVSMDEITTGLNDSICEDVLRAIIKYCKDKVIFIASHQVNIVSKLCNKRIEFEEVSPEKYTVNLIEQ